MKTDYEIRTQVDEHSGINEAWAILFRNGHVESETPVFFAKTEDEAVSKLKAFLHSHLDFRTGLISGAILD